MSRARERAHRFVLAVCVGGVLSAAASAGGRLARAEFELAGPLSAFEVQAGDGGRTRVDGALAAGESVRVVLPIPLADADRLAPPEPLATWDLDDEGPRGRARFVRWVDDAGAAELERAPPGLRARPRPPVRSDPARAGLASAALLAAALAAVVAARRRPAVALLVAALGAVLAAALVPRPVDGARSVRILEGLAEASIGVEVRAGASELRLPRAVLEAGGSLELEPRGAPVQVELGGFDARAELRLVARGARLAWTRVVPAPEGLTLDRNDGPALEAAWLREAGEWRALGPWGTGATRPEGTVGSPPEGWLLGGLPQGVDVLVARRGDPEGTHWLRLAR
ncbi:MAG: hypothetical protein IPJ77_19330 [Planctomycetes bacterium]|nr:hypothetical protein [Planctomycetota bacterium]